MTSRQIIRELIVPAREGRGIEVHIGEILRIIAIDGPQVADTAFINLDDPREGYHAGQSVAFNMLAGTGTMRYLTHLYSRPPRENLMMTVVDDPLREHFVWNGGRCSRRMYEIRDSMADHHSCQDNLTAAVAPWGLSGDDVPDIFNVFQYLDVEDEAKLVFRESKAKPGDYIDFRAEMNILAAVSACPSETSASNGFQPKRIALEVWRPK